MCGTGTMRGIGCDTILPAKKAWSRGLEQDWVMHRELPSDILTDVSDWYDSRLPVVPMLFC